jgi:hypothetical protein
MITINDDPGRVVAGYVGGAALCVATDIGAALSATEMDTVGFTETEAGVLCEPASVSDEEESPLCADDNRHDPLCRPHPVERIGPIDPKYREIRE